MGCSEGGRPAAAAAGVVGSGPLHAGVVGRADRVGAALLACYWYPKQLPTRDVGNQQESQKLKTDLNFIASDYSVITSLSPQKGETKQLQQCVFLQ